MKKLKVLIVGVIILIIGFVIWRHYMEPKSDKINITMLGENSSTLKAMIALKEEYDKSGSNVNIVYKANTFDDALMKSNQDFANRTGLYDIVVQYNFTLSSSVRNNYVYDLGELLKDVAKEKKQFEKDIFPVLWKEVGQYYNNAIDPSKGTKIVSYPYLGISMVLMYNKTMFEDPGNKTRYFARFGKELVVPNNWEDYYKIAQFFTNTEEGTYGVCMEGAPHGLLTAEWTNFLYSFGGRYLDKNVGWHGDAQTKVLINSPASVNALNYYVSLKPFNNGNFTDVDQVQQMRIMKEGKTAMAIAWTDMLYEVLKKPNGMDETFGFATIPGGKSIISGGAYFINRQSKHPKEAAKFIVDQLQPEMQIKLARLGLCSPLQSVYKDVEVQKLPYTRALEASLHRGGIFLEAGPDADLISEAITTNIQKAWAGEISATKAMSNAHNEIVAKRSEVFINLKN